MASKKLIFVCLAVATVCMFSPISVFAEDTELQKVGLVSENTSNSSDTKDVNLISKRNLSCYNDSNHVYISSFTVGNAVMAKIGIIDIQVQQSTNGVNGWTTCVPKFDLTESNTSACYVNDYGVLVSPGYYYRVIVTHYAKETGWFFPDSQSVTVTSGVLWIN